MLDLVGVEGEIRAIEGKTDPAARKLMRAENRPICVTLDKIGDCFVTDPLQGEELCTTAQMTVAVDPEGSACGVQKSGAALLRWKRCSR